MLHRLRPGSGEMPRGKNALPALVLLALTAGSPLHDLATLFACAIEPEGSRVCCLAAREARRSADAEARAVIDDYLRRSCKSKDR